MFFQDLRALFAESIAWLMLNQPVDEISSLEGPAVGDLVLVNLDLLREDVVSDLLTVFAMVRPLAEHALIGNDTHGEVVNCHTMILSAHNLRRHIPGRSRSVFGVLGIPATSNTQISHSQIALLVENEVLWLDITVQNGVLVEILQAQQHAGDKELYDSN